MPRHEQVLSVFIASPFDVADERSRIEEAITELNAVWSRTLGMRLELVGWETHSRPSLGDDPQQVINSQISPDYDIFIGIMWCRFGTPTPRAGSGTEEEFLQAQARWESNRSSIEVMFYFKDEPSPLPPTQLDFSQLSKIAEFRKGLGQHAIYASFQTADDFVNQVRVHLSRIVQEWSTRIALPVGIKAPSAANHFNTDAEEYGIFELTEQFEDNMEVAAEFATRIVKAMEVIAKKVQDHAVRAQAASASGVKRKDAKRLIDKAAKDISAFSVNLDKEVPSFRRHSTDGLSAISQAISLWPVLGDVSQRDDVLQWVAAINSLLSVIAGAEEGTMAFLTNVEALPRLTVDLNKARQSTARSLRSFIDVLKNTRGLVESAGASANDLYSRLSGNAAQT